jgi:hypothetical protein
MNALPSPTKAVSPIRALLSAEQRKRLFAKRCRSGAGGSARRAWCPRPGARWCNAPPPRTARLHRPALRAAPPRSGSQTERTEQPGSPPGRVCCGSGMCWSVLALMRASASAREPRRLTDDEWATTPLYLPWPMPRQCGRICCRKGRSRWRNSWHAFSAPQEQPECTSVRHSSVHAQIRIEELQSGVPDVIVQFGSVHARGIDAGLGIVIPSDLVALIVEDLVANTAG